jgi:hypothetical protein
MTERAEETTTCCIAGGGPAGMMLGLLLARAGIGVTVLEKHGDFLRDFRGDTIHTSTITLMEELGLADRFLQLPHQKAHELSALVGNTRVRICDFSALEGPHPYILFMPQWDFLNFIAAEARKYPGFRLIMNAERSASSAPAIARRAWSIARTMKCTPSVPTSRSPATGGIRPCDGPGTFSPAATARPWMSCGSACRARATKGRTRALIWSAAACSS